MSGSAPAASSCVAVLGALVMNDVNKGTGKCPISVLLGQGVKALLSACREVRRPSLPLYSMSLDAALPS